MEVDRECEKAGDDSELDDEGGFDEGAAHGLFAVGELGVGAVGGAVAVEGFNNGGDGAEGCEDAAWMDGGVVRDVVEDTAKGYIIGEFVEGTGREVVSGGCLRGWRGRYGAA